MRVCDLFEICVASLPVTLISAPLDPQCVSPLLFPLPLALSEVSVSLRLNPVLPLARDHSALRLHVARSLSRFLSRQGCRVNGEGWITLETKIFQGMHYKKGLWDVFFECCDQMQIFFSWIKFFKRQQALSCLSLMSVIQRLILITDIVANVENFPPFWQKKNNLKHRQEVGCSHVTAWN